MKNPYMFEYMTGYIYNKTFAFTTDHRNYGKRRGAKTRNEVEERSHKTHAGIKVNDIDIIIYRTRMCPKYTDDPSALSFYMFSGQWKWSKNYNWASKLERSYHIGNMCTEFQVNWTSTSSKTTSTTKFNLKRDEWTNGRTDAQTRKHNAHKWAIKKQKYQFSKIENIIKFKRREMSLQVGKYPINRRKRPAWRRCLTLDSIYVYIHNK